MGANKKLVRKAFRDACFARDNYSCVMCGKKSSPEKAIEDLDAHHITDRSVMPYQGYCQQNGISLCSECHVKAERFHSTGTAYPGYSPDDLYAKIGSSYEEAVEASKKLKGD
jgi:5-methylcytosine-specific restriction endonuclease McrA